MNDLPSLQAWLNQAPLPEEIRYNEDNSEYIPIEFIKPKLDYFSPNWSRSNFTHFTFETDSFDRAGNRIGKDIMVSGSVELTVEYSCHTKTAYSNNSNIGEPKTQTIKRVLVGSATFDTKKYYPNINWGQICLSLATVSAAKELGTFFGKDLNKDRLTVPTVNGKQKKTPDIMIKKQMANAVVANDQKTIDNLSKTYNFV